MTELDAQFSSPSPADESDEADETVALAPPQMWTRGFLIAIAVVAILIVFMLRELTLTFDEPLDPILWGLPVLSTAILALIRRLWIPNKARQIHLQKSQLSLPRGRNSRRTVDVAYDQIRTIVPLVSRGQPALVIDSKHHTQIYVASDFDHPETWRLLWGLIVDRIRAGAEGRAQFQRMQHLAELSQQTSSVTGELSRKFLWFLAAIFAAQTFLAPPVDVLEFLSFGANSPLLVFEHDQWWRLVTANLLHGNALHFVVNAFALYFLGTYCERLFGRLQTVIILGTTAIAGAIASTFAAQALFSVGISTALFGLVGAYLALHLKMGKQLPPPYRQTRRWWIIILGLNGVLSFAVPMIDGWGHLGGFVAGLAVGWLLLRGKKRFQPHPQSGRLVQIAAAGLVALFAACTLVAITYAMGDHSDDQVALAQKIQETMADEDAVWLAQIAHQWSNYDPRAEEIDRSLLAIAHHVRHTTNDYYAHQWSSKAILNITSEDPPARLALSPIESVRVTEQGIALEPVGPNENARWVYLIVHGEDDRPEQLLARCVPIGESSGSAAKVAGDLPPRFDLSLALIIGSADCEEDESRYWQALLDHSSD